MKLRGSVKEYFINFSPFWKVIIFETIGAAKNLRSTITENTLWIIYLHIALSGFTAVWRSIDTFFAQIQINWTLPPLITFPELRL